jgi:hypothetical protein
MGSSIDRLSLDFISERRRPLRRANPQEAIWSLTIPVRSTAHHSGDPRHAVSQSNPDRFEAVNLQAQIEQLTNYN